MLLFNLLIRFQLLIIVGQYPLNLSSNLAADNTAFVTFCGSFNHDTALFAFDSEDQPFV